MGLTLNESRKPTRWLGRLMLWSMNIRHSGLTDWGLTHVQVKGDSTVLDVGCGGGRTIQKLAAIAKDGNIYGVDYADGSVAASRALNSESIQSGLVDVRQASVSNLPFGDNHFDLVTAIETQYYWPDAAKDMQEIRRVLKPGGRLLVVAESYKRGESNRLDWVETRLLRFKEVSVQEERGLFSASGFSDVEVFEERSKGWMCAVGTKR